MEKVKFRFKDKNTNSFAYENFWAEQLDDTHYQLKNVPFHVRLLAFNDILEVEKINDELIVKKILGSCGHSTIRVVFCENFDYEVVTNGINKLGGTFEASKKLGMLAIDIPKDTKYLPIRFFLEKLLAEEQLDYEEPCISAEHGAEIAEYEK